MNSFTHVNTLLDALAQRYGIAGLRLNDAGMAALRLGDETELTFEFVAARDKLFVYAPLRDVPASPARRAAVLACALQLNCMESGAADAVIALDRYGETLLLQIGLPVPDLDVDRFDRAVHAFLAQIDDIDRRLAAAGDVQADAAQPAERSAAPASLTLLKRKPAVRTH